MSVLFFVFYLLPMFILSIPVSAYLKHREKEKKEREKEEQRKRMEEMLSKNFHQKHPSDADFHVTCKGTFWIKS